MHITEQVDLDILSDMRSPYGIANLSAGIVVGDNVVVIYGPYMELQPGRYKIVVSGQIDRPEGCYIDAACSNGQLILGMAAWTNGSTALEVEIAFPTSQFEIRVLGRRGAKIVIDGLSVTRHYNKLSQRTFAEYHRMGLRLTLDPSSFVDRFLIDNGHWDEAHIKYLKDAAFRIGRKDRDLVFLDIGAYFGLYSMVMAYTNLFDRIVAFEADTLNFRQLTANLLINDPRCLIETQGIAVSNEPGTATFLSSADHPQGNRGGVGIDHVGTTVKKDKIDNLLDIKGRKIIAKIDVEGHEMPVLKGMISTLLNNNMLIQIEVLGESRHVNTFLESCKYKFIHKIDHDYYFTNINF